jgi:hypothetical protein
MESHGSVLLGAALGITETDVSGPKITAAKTPKDKPGPTAAAIPTMEGSLVVESCFVTENPEKRLSLNLVGAPKTGHFLRQNWCPFVDNRNFQGQHCPRCITTGL